MSWCHFFPTFFSPILVVLVLLGSSIITAEQQPNHGFLQPLQVDDSFVVSETHFALDELKKLSDSTIYTTISLIRVVNAFHEDGIFHDNTILELELSSPYFKSKKSLEVFHVFVMTHKEDGIKSFAINEFPVMDASAIERFYIDKVERKKREREEYFRLLEIEAMPDTIKAHLDLNTMTNVSRFLDTIENSAVFGVEQVRKTFSLNIQPQLFGTNLDQEQDLLMMPLRDMFAISLGTKEATDFQKYRAQKTLDNIITHLLLFES